jgi:hypothetical protein
MGLEEEEKEEEQEEKEEEINKVKAQVFRKIPINVLNFLKSENSKSKIEVLEISDWIFSK